MPESEGKHDKTKKNHQYRPQKKETFLKVSRKSLKSFVDKPIMLKKLPKLPFNRVFIVRASHATKT